jgi:hypothetical protein
MKAVRFVSLLIVLGLSMSALAQEGHPLVGVWSGDWGPSATHRNHITMMMTWDGKAVKGMMNPGPDAINLQTVSLDSSKWTVHFEFEAKDAKGGVVRYIADGRIENLGSHNRTITGTWNHGNVKGDFKLRRD